MTDYNIFSFDNSVYVFGHNSYGQLGLGHNNNINKPTLLMQDPTIKSISHGYHHSMILKENGELFVFGYNKYGQLGLGHNNNINKPTLLMQDPTIKSICCGSYYSMILKENGELFVFGGNSYGQLGFGHNNAINKPTLLMTNKSINFHQIQQTSIIWNHNNHTFYPKEFKERISTFTLYLKRNQVNTKLKIPKFVLFEIIKYI